MTAARAGAVALVMATCLGCGERGDVSESTYATRLDAQAAGALTDGGSIPQWLPRTARDLREARARQTKQSLLFFRYDRGNRLTVPGSCVPVTEVPAAPFRVSWWPSDIPPPSGATTRYVFYSCESGRAFVAVTVGRSEVYYWRP